MRTLVIVLGGERVDVVLSGENPVRGIESTLATAKVSHVIIDPDPENTYATVIVPDDQLSLAIGKEGQNARLAARLTGYHIDIKNESLASKVLESLPTRDSADALEDQEDGGHRCEYVGPTGIRCRNMARPGSRFCGIHEKLQEISDVPVSDDPDSLI